MKVLVVLCAIIAVGFSVPIEKWHRSSDGCPYYIEFEQKFNWYQAWEECLDKNMTLLAMDTMYKQQQVDALVKRLFPKNLTYWLAGHDNAVEKRHVWSTTGKIFDFTNWASGQPNYATNDHCIFVHDSTNQWHDFPCASKLGFVCENMQCSSEKTPGFVAEQWGDAQKYNVHVWNVFGNHK